jgi:hypothetical protein
MIHTLKYTSNSHAVEDLTAKGIITENGFGEGIQAVVYNGFKQLTEGDEKTEPTFGRDFFVTVMSTRTDLHFDNRIFDSNAENTFGIETKDKETRVFEADKAFGQHLIDTFLLDNRKQRQSFNAQQSMAMLQKFSVVKALSEVADIKNVRLLLSSFELDTVFTQERKDKYVQMCAEHIYLNS